MTSWWRNMSDIFYILSIPEMLYYHVITLKSSLDTLVKWYNVPNFGTYDCCRVGDFPLLTLIPLYLYYGIVCMAYALTYRQLLEMAIGWKASPKDELCQTSENFNFDEPNTLQICARWEKQYGTYWTHEVEVLCNEAGQSVRPSVCHSNNSIGDWWIYLIFCMKVEGNIIRKLTKPDSRKKI